MSTTIFSVLRTKVSSIIPRTMSSVVSGNMKPNRLAEEKSPYLLQHSHNPVDWFPWGDEAFQRAQAEDKPIFLSVGYSTCHWCHVMERESFENPEIGEILNKYFVSIKVDREERPDVDKMYMTFIQVLVGGGGWPMSVFLTPKLEPITGGTYFPPHDQYGRPGFASVLKMIAKKWEEDKSSVLKQGETLAAAVKEAVCEKQERNLPKMEQVVDRCYRHFEDTFDHTYGGFARAPKFPQPSNLQFLLHYYWSNRDEDSGKRALQMVEKTLTCMAQGGIHDHISQGFHRYSVDERWHVPHFEKMLYDQSQLVSVYAQAYLITRNEQYKLIIDDIFTYVNRDLSHPEGGLYSAEDADSLPTADCTEKREGAFCVWTKQDIDSLLDRTYENTTLAEMFSTHFSVEAGGNVPRYADPHDELKNQNVLMCAGPIEDTATRLEMPKDCLEKGLNEAKKILFDARALRPRPHLDNKIITAWNGLMVGGLAKASAALNDEEYNRKALKIVEFIRNRLTVENGQLLRSIYTNEHKIGGLVQIKNPILAFADDYAFLIEGLLDLYETTFDDSLLKMAVDLQSVMDAYFWDTQNDCGYFLGAQDESILIRMKEDQDGAEPATNSVAASNLVRLADILDKAQMRDRAGRLFAGFCQRLAKFPFVLPKMVLAYERWARPPTQIVIVGSRNDSTVQQMLETVRRMFLPWKSLISLDTEKDLYLLSEVSHYRELCSGAKDKPTAFICDNFVCSLPITTCDQLQQRLDQIK